MPRVEFSEENKISTTNYDFPRLKLKKDERARIMAGLESPIMEYVHTLRAPVVENGRAVFETVTKFNGTKSEEYKMNFISRPLCAGDPAKLANNGSDPINCPVCKLAQEHPDMAKAPEPRYAMHIIRYRTKSGSFDIQTPFSVELLVWSFSPKVFNKIADIKKEFTSLQKNDLTLGPCTSENFQQFEISVGAKSEWTQDEERKKLVAQTFKENQIPDLSVAAGSRKERKWLDEDILKIQNAWNSINGTAPVGDSRSLDEDLNDLVAVSAPKGAAPQEAWLPDADKNDAPEAQSSKPVAASSEDALDFEDLLANLS